jgi:uncharacterized protein (TIGR03067 family)
LLAKRLARCGLAITGATLGMLLTPKAATAAIPASLTASTLEAAMAGAAPPVTALAEGVLKAMLMSKLKVLMTWALVAGLLVGGVAIWRMRMVNEARAAREEALEYAARARADALNDNDEDNILGTWTLVRIEQVSRKQKEEPPPQGTAKVVFHPDRVKLWDGSEARYGLDAGKHPRQFRLTQGEGMLAATLIGIYELKGDSLKICFNLSHSDNRTPTSFNVQAAQPPGYVPVVYVLKRDPVKEAPKADEAKKAEAEKSAPVQVRFVGPAGAKIRRFEDDDKSAKEMPCRLTFDKPGLYRLKLTNIPNRPGLELYPTVEVCPATAETTTFLTHNAVPVEFTDAEIDKAVKGQLAVRAVCLHQDGDHTFAITEAPTNDDVIGLAKKKGPILVVARLGSIDLEAKKDADDPYRAALIAAVHHFAGDRDELDHLKTMLEKHPDLLDTKQIYRQPHKPSRGDSFTPLIVAVEQGCEDNAAYLLSKGANVQADDWLQGWTPLHIVARQGDVAMAKLLVKYHAKLDAKDKSDRTPLDLATERKKPEMVEYLKSVSK